MSKPLFAAELSDLIAELYAPTPASPAEWAAIERDLAYLGRRSEPDAMVVRAVMRRSGDRRSAEDHSYEAAGDRCRVAPRPLNPAERLAALDQASFFFGPMLWEDCESRRKSDGAKSVTERRASAERRLASRRNSLKTVSQVP